MSKGLMVELYLGVSSEPLTGFLGWLQNYLPFIDFSQNAYVANFSDGYHIESADQENLLDRFIEDLKRTDYDQIKIQVYPSFLKPLGLSLADEIKDPLLEYIIERFKQFEIAHSKGINLEVIGYSS